ncbi:MAG: hypothetical protein AAFQ71_11470 [Planctomycetota bacterium]
MSDNGEKTAGEGIPCPKCGCKHHRTYGGRRISNRYQRYRMCRDCGWQFKTMEALVRDDEEAKDVQDIEESHA